MKSDSLFYRLFRELPSCYFEAIGDDAKRAEEYEFRSETIKQAGLSMDGIFVPIRHAQPVHFVEVYCYAADNAYSNLFAKVFLWLETNDPGQDWHASIFFAARRQETTQLRPYRNLINSDQVSRIYLDELPEPDQGQVGLGILNLIGTSRERAVVKAQALLHWIQRREKPFAAQRKLVELIEAVILAHFPRLSREELKQMVETLDLSKTRVYQDARAEGLAEGRAKGKAEGMAEGKAEGKAEGRAETRQEIAIRLLRKKTAPATVAELTSLTLREVRRLNKSLQ